MKNLVLRSNQLSGSIPSALGNLDELRILKLDNNRLSGSIPQTLGLLVRLEELSVAGNPQLSGSIPDELCRLSTLNLTRANIGCELHCHCCLDLSKLCEQSRRGHMSAWLTWRARGRWPFWKRLEMSLLHRWLEFTADFWSLHQVYHAAPFLPLKRGVWMRLGRDRSWSYLCETETHATRLKRNWRM